MENKDENYSEAMSRLLEDLRDQMRARIKIGTIVSVFDKEHPEYLKEIFIVIGFQSNSNSKELIVALMDHNYKKFLVHINNIILKSLFTIDDMFPPRSIILQPMSRRL